MLSREDLMASAFAGTSSESHQLASRFTLNERKNSLQRYYPLFPHTSTKRIPECPPAQAPANKPGIASNRRGPKQASRTVTLEITSRAVDATNNLH